MTAAPRLLRSGLLLLLVLALGACGFHMRGAFKLPYQSIYINLPDTSVLGADLRRQITASNATRLASRPEEADAIFQQVSESQDKVILSLNTQGRAKENQLRLYYSFRVTDAKGHQLVPVNTIVLARDITYDDSKILAKDQEEAFLWADMRKDLSNQILRRLTALQPQTTPPEEEAF